MQSSSHFLLYFVCSWWLLSLVTVRFMNFWSGFCVSRFVSPVALSVLLPAEELPEDG
jgi:hypothetical protein